MSNGRGRTGEAGATGAPGRQGETGAVGRQGEIGATGETGAYVATTLVTQIKRQLRWLTIVVVVLAVLVGGIGVKAFHDSGENKDALCTLRGDLQKRVDTSKTFLIDNPKGIPGISPKVFRTSLANQESTIKALSNLNC